MVLFGINFVLLVEDLRVEDLIFLEPFFADDYVFDGLAQRSMQLINLLLE